ncbi:LytTR family DNA-binding domain-containing protein [Aestuariibacter halophilus]|uniref:LytTR family DNA-binding domain-containing protein n=1 Tax=Fluctibacter halophilus TaxID=226011 RepID=A0ABS8G869_9ALTE|nr:LytTR family DNA-binding domain-containing protein [Aestuariibacter halophilus]MCC2616623.1 LytTR family DNA-binding domain-containing protein [Aestuariibacter halophilus]
MEQIAAVVVDDETLAREGLVKRLEEHDDITIVAQCRDGNDALSVLRATTPDVLFVDIEMPGLTGLELVTQLQREKRLPTQIVFVTAYKEFACQAFDCQAFDYLLKPFSEERLAVCLLNLRQARQVMCANQRQQQLESLLTRKTGRGVTHLIQTLDQVDRLDLAELPNTIALKSGNDWLRVPLSSIDWIEAAGDYMCLHTVKGDHIVRVTLKELEHQLDPTLFARVNRSAIINLSRLERLRPNSNGEYLALLSTGDEVKVSRKYKFRLEELRKPA